MVNNKKITDKTTVALSKTVKQRLDALGTKVDTYDDIIRRLLDALDKVKDIT